MHCSLYFLIFSLGQQQVKGVGGSLEALLPGYIGRYLLVVVAVESQD
jgi:hypothetical protein